MNSANSQKGQVWIEVLLWVGVATGSLWSLSQIYGRSYRAYRVLLENYRPPAERVRSLQRQPLEGFRDKRSSAPLVE